MKPSPVFFSMLGSIFLSNCEDPPPPLEGAALVARREQIRLEVGQALIDPAGALLGEESYVIRNPSLLAAAEAEVMERCEPWMAGDIERLRFFLEGHLTGARGRLLENETAIRELEQLIAARHADPRVDRRTVATAGREPSQVDRAIAHFGGLLLSGRSIPPLLVPPREYVEISADYGILPSPLEANEKGKYNTLPVRFVRRGNPWVHPDDPGRPADSVVARLLLDRIAASPEASRIVVRVTVLPALGSPQTWEFSVERASGGEDAIIIGPGDAENEARGMPPREVTLRELEMLAAKAPRQAK